MENLLVSDIAKILEEKNFNMILYLNGGYIDQKISHFLSQEIYGK